MTLVNILTSDLHVLISKTGNSRPEREYFKVVVKTRTYYYMKVDFYYLEAITSAEVYRRISKNICIRLRR